MYWVTQNITQHNTKDMHARTPYQCYIITYTYVNTLSSILNKFFTELVKMHAFIAFSIKNTCNATSK